MTYAILRVGQHAYAEVAGKLREADYQHAFVDHPEGMLLVLGEIALQAVDDQEEDDRRWSLGYRAAWRGIAQTAAGHLTGPEGDPQTSRLLTLLAERHDWPDELHLADVIDKHLGRYLGA